MPDGSNIKALYQVASKDYDLGTYDEFEKRLQDPKNREVLFNTIGKEYDLGDYTTFNSKLGFDSKEIQSAATAGASVGSNIGQFANAQKPTGTITEEQVLKGQQQSQAAQGKTLEQQQVAQYGGEVQKVKDEKVYQAAVNTVNKKHEAGAFSPPKEGQIKDLLKAYDNGDLAIDDQTGTLKRTGNFFQSFKAAADETYARQLESNYLASLPKDKAIEYLNQQRQHPELFTHESEIAPTGVSKFVGEQSQILGKGIIGGLSGAYLAPETGGASFGTFLAMAKDLGTGGYSEALKKNYNILKQQQPELSDDEIYDKAHQAALTGEAVSLATGAILSAQLPKPKIDVSGVIQMFKSSPRVVGSAAAGSVVNDIQTNLISAGQGVTWEQMKDNAEKSAEPMALMHFGLGTMTAVVNGSKNSVPSYIRPQLENVVASADRNEVKNYLGTGEQNGMFPQGTTQKVLDKLNEFDVQKEVVKNMPISEEKKAAITGKLIQRKDLIEQTNTLKSYGGAFENKVAENEKQISAINKDINDIYSSDNFLKHERDAITGEKAKDQIKAQEPIQETVSGTSTVNEPTSKSTVEAKPTETSIVETPQAPTENRQELINEANSYADDVQGLYSGVFKKDPERALFEAATQLNSSGSEAKTARSIFGDRISDIALKLFPDAKVGDKFEKTNVGEVVHEPTTISKSEIDAIEKEINERDQVSSTSIGGEGERQSITTTIGGIEVPYTKSEINQINEIEKRLPEKVDNGVDVNWEQRHKEELAVHKAVLQRHLNELKAKKQSSAKPTTIHTKEQSITTKPTTELPKEESKVETEYQSKIKSIEDNRTKALEKQREKNEADFLKPYEKSFLATEEGGKLKQQFNEKYDELYGSTEEEVNAKFNDQIKELNKKENEKLNKEIETVNEERKQKVAKVQEKIIEPLEYIDDSVAKKAVIEKGGKVRRITNKKTGEQIEKIEDLTVRDKQNEIKKKEKILQKIIDCIHA